MITDRFRKVEKEDFPLIGEYLAKAHYHEANHNLINMAIWLDLYPLYSYREDDFLLLAGIHEGSYFLYMPLCEKQYFLKAVNKAEELMADCHLTFYMSCFTKEYVELLQETHSHLTVKEIPVSADYIYEAESLRTFKGKKMQKKRNHYNNFIKNVSYRYEELSSSNLEELKQFVLSLKPEGEFLECEQRGILRLLEWRDVLPYECGMIKISDKISAFIIASSLSPVMAQENVEKADKKIPGLPQAMIHEFFNHHFTDVTYINREDDMGLENLRQSKMSYNPCFMISKYSLIDHDSRSATKR